MLKSPKDDPMAIQEVIFHLVPKISPFLGGITWSIDDCHQDG